VKRFWDRASAAPARGGFVILLDGKPIHLPGGALLTVSRPLLAEAIADEWQRAGRVKEGEMSFADTPLTRLAGTAQERIAPDPGPTVDALARYAETDLLCYRAEAPAALVRRQARDWQPWLDWAALTYDAPLLVTTGVRYVHQNEGAVFALRRALSGLDASMLAGLGVAVPALGSLVLGLALSEGKLEARAAHDLACLDELFQAELWGQDAEASDRRHRIGDDVELAARFMDLIHRGKVA
jgi:chaperone required for assembly of F1-ATPase